MDNDVKINEAVKEAIKNTVLKTLSGYYVQNKRIVINNKDDDSGVYEFGVDEGEIHKVFAVLKKIGTQSVPKDGKYENIYFAKIEFAYQFFYESEKYKVSINEDIELNNFFKTRITRHIDEIFRLYGYYLDNLRYVNSETLLDKLIPEEKRVFLTNKGFELPVVETKAYEGKIDISHSGLGPDNHFVKLEHFFSPIIVKSNRHPLFSMSITDKVDYLINNSFVSEQRFYENLMNTENDENIPFKI